MEHSLFSESFELNIRFDKDTNELILDEDITMDLGKNYDFSDVTDAILLYLTNVGVIQPDEFA